MELQPLYFLIIMIIGGVKRTTSEASAEHSLIPKWSASIFSYPYQHIFKQTGDENRDNHQLGILSWCTTKFSDLTLKETQRSVRRITILNSSGSDWRNVTYTCCALSSSCFLISSSSVVSFFCFTLNASHSLSQSNLASPLWTMWHGKSFQQKTKNVQFLWSRT